MNQVTESRPQIAAVAAVSPARLAHVVLRSSQFDALVDWYKTVLCARIAFSDGALAFLSYDEEHHRIAVLNIPGLQRQPSGMTGMHHMAFTYASLSDLDRLGIRPITCINHGPTTSMYYADPDGNQVELQIDNYDTVEEAGKFFYSAAFAKNPIGVDFEPADLVKRFRAGEDEATIKKRPDSGARGLDTLNLQ